MNHEGHVFFKTSTKRWSVRRGTPKRKRRPQHWALKTINGVSAQGTRITRTIPAGEIGNQKPIVITIEKWYSPDLQETVMTKRNDPRMGETVFQLTNIQRAEPAATTLFRCLPITL